MVFGMRRIVCRINRTCSALTSPTATACASAGWRGGNNSPVDNDRPGTRSSACDSHDPAAAAEQFSSCRSNAASDRQPCCSASPRTFTSAKAALRPAGSCRSTRSMRRTPSSSSSSISTDQSTSRIARAPASYMRSAVRRSVAMKKSVNPVTDNSGLVHSRIGTDQVKQFLTIILWIRSSARRFLSDPTDKG